MIDNRAGAVQKVQPRVRRAAVYGYGIVSDPLPRGLELAVEALAGFEHQHRGARARRLLREGPG